jgi:hypothetical protein
VHRSKWQAAMRLRNWAGILECRVFAQLHRWTQSSGSTSDRAACTTDDHLVGAVHGCWSTTYFGPSILSSTIIIRQLFWPRPDPCFPGSGSGSAGPCCLRGSGWDCAVPCSHWAWVSALGPPAPPGSSAPSAPPQDFDSPALEAPGISPPLLRVSLGGA